MGSLTETTPLSDIEFVAFDTETTGLSPVVAKLVELSGVKFKYDGEIVSTFSTLIDPGTDIPREASTIHGITNKMVKGQPSCSEAIPEFIHWAGPSPVLAAHNAKFDLGFLEVALSRIPLEPPTFPVIDTLALSRRLVPAAPNHQLKTLAEHLGFQSGEYHRALADSHHVRNLLLKLFAIAPDVQTWQDFGKITTIHQLSDLSSAALKMLDRMPAGFEQLREAISSGSLLNMTYQGFGSSSARMVTPRSIHTWRGNVYLTAYCHSACEERTFRVDKIRNFQTVAVEDAAVISAAGVSELIGEVK
jgi:DNA polymerase III epsilon subunit family exonuclease